MENEQPVWVSTNYSSEQQIKVGPFSGAAIYLAGASFFGGLVISYLLIRELGWPFMTSSLLGFLLPSGVCLILLKLVVGKPYGYCLDWLEFQTLKLLGKPLINHSQLKGERQ